MRANQLRLWFASMAYVLMCALRRIGLPHTQFAEATCGTIRLKLLKIGALVRVSVRRIKFAMASGCPWQREWALVHARLRNAAAERGPQTQPATKEHSRVIDGVMVIPGSKPHVARELIRNDRRRQRPDADPAAAASAR